MKKDLMQNFSFPIYKRTRERYLTFKKENKLTHDEAINKLLDVYEKSDKKKVLSWEKENVNYWENVDCPRLFLEDSLISLAEFVEGYEMTREEVEKMSTKDLIDKVEFYEYVADK